MEKFSQLKNKTLMFKPMEAEDAKHIHAYASDPEVSRFIGWPLMGTLEETENYVSVMLTREYEATHFYANVVLCDGLVLIGTMMIFNVDLQDKTAEIGYVFHKNYWGKGYGAMCVEMTTNFLFDEMGFKTIYANVVSANRGSSKILEKNSYELAECKASAYVIDGVSYDQWCYERRAK